MAKDKETPEEVDELSGWRKLHQDYLEKKEREEKERKEREEKERREILKTVPKRQPSDEDEDLEEGDQGEAETEENVIPTIPFIGDEEEIEKPEKVRIPARHLFRAVPVLTIASLLSALSIYFMTPLATQKVIEVSGNAEVSSEDIIRDSAIHDEDYAVTTLLSRQGHERNIRASSPWIESVQMTYAFPNRFGIQIKEYDVVAYEQRDGQRYPILTNGVVVPTATTSASAESGLQVLFNDQGKIATLVQQLEKMPVSLKSRIRTVELTPSKATEDLLTLTMDGDHQVIIPLSDLDRKLSYYDSIVSQLTEPNIIDMESGIFSYSQAEVARRAEAARQASEENPDENTESTPENAGIPAESGESPATEESQQIGT